MEHAVFGVDLAQYDLELFVVVLGIVERRYLYTCGKHRNDVIDDTSEFFRQIDVVEHRLGHSESRVIGDVAEIIAGEPLEIHVKPAACVIARRDHGIGVLSVGEHDREFVEGVILGIQIAFGVEIEFRVERGYVYRSCKMRLPVTLRIVIGIERRIHLAGNIYLSRPVRCGVRRGKIIPAYIVALRSVEHDIEASRGVSFRVKLVEHHHKTRRVEKPYLRFAEVAYVETEEIVAQSVKFGTQRRNILSYVIVYRTFQSVEVYVLDGDRIRILVDVYLGDVVGDGERGKAFDI